ncbi:MAG: DNA primase [Thiobacillaceae bacterium]
MIPRDFIDTLLARVDIVDVIDRRVSLKKAGQNYQACCPFHNEKTPSFTVSQTKQFYHCFGCGAHGTALGFLMEYEHMSFRDAVAALAQDAGLPVPESASEPDRPKPPPALWDALEQAAVFYKQQLKQSPHAIDYLKRRGLSGQIAARYGIGYAPADGGLKLVFPDYQADALAVSGMVIDNERGRYDRFRDRIMFPIKNSKGQIIGFGGRILDQGEPKYLNSPETPLFHKGSEMYGLFEARDAIKQAGRVVVVEGYMDVVALAQHGVGFAVATLGTATSATHVRTLLRHSDHLIYSFDGDNAGRKAAWRALENSLESLQDGKDISFLFLPDGEDPDSYIRAQGSDAFIHLLDTQTMPLSAFLLRELTRGGALESAEGRARLLKSAKPLLDKISAPLLAGLLRQKIADLADLQSTDLAQFGLGAATKNRPAPLARGRRPAPSKLRNLARSLLIHPQRAREIQPEWLDPNDPWAATIGDMLDWLRPYDAAKTLSALIEDARDSALQARVEELAADMLKLDEHWDWGAELDATIKQLHEDWRQRRKQALGARPLASLNADERAELVSLSGA